MKKLNKYSFTAKLLSLLSALQIDLHTVIDGFLKEINQIDTPLEDKIKTLQIVQKSLIDLNEKSIKISIDVVDENIDLIQQKIDSTRYTMAEFYGELSELMRDGVVDSIVRTGKVLVINDSIYVSFLADKYAIATDEKNYYPKTLKNVSNTIKNFLNQQQQ